MPEVHVTPEQRYELYEMLADLEVETEGDTMRVVWWWTSTGPQPVLWPMLLRPQDRYVD